MTTNDDDVYLRESLWGLLVILGLVLIGLFACIVYAMADEMISIKEPGLYRCTPTLTDYAGSFECHAVAEAQACPSPQSFVGPSTVTTDPQLANWAHGQCTTQQAIQASVRVCMHDKGVRWDNRP